MSDNFSDFMDAGWSYRSGGGGGAYELIESFTVQSAAVISRTEEPNGKPYKFKALFVHMCMPESVTEIAGCNHTFVNSDNDFSIVYTAAVSANASLKATSIEISKLSGVWVTRGKDFGSRQYSNTCKIGVPYQFKSGSYIKEYKTSVPIPAGVQIEIWGVRA